MRFSWDPAKERRNLAKHGWGFSIAGKLFEDPFGTIEPDRFVDGEERWHLFASMHHGTTFHLFVVVFCYPDPEDETYVRIISLRPATHRERRTLGGN